MTSVADNTLVNSLTDQAAQRPDSIRAGESLLIRLFILLTSPLWCSAVLAAAVVRLVRGRLPLLVLHERVGFQRTSLAVPKLATAAVASNRRSFGGLVEKATGPPVDLDIEGRFEEWLRRTGLDELPQLALIAAGKMRLVGPRPVTACELNVMLEDGEVGIDVLQPGLIGLWQVLDRHAYLLPERRELDLIMINNWSGRFRRRVVVLALRQALRRSAG